MATTRYYDSNETTTFVVVVVAGRDYLICAEEQATKICEAINNK